MVQSLQEDFIFKIKIKLKCNVYLFFLNENINIYIYTYILILFFFFIIICTYNNNNSTNASPVSRCYGHKSTIKKLAASKNSPYLSSLDYQNNVIIWNSTDSSVSLYLKTNIFKFNIY